MVSGFGFADTLSADIDAQDGEQRHRGGITNEESLELGEVLSVGISDSLEMVVEEQIDHRRNENIETQPDGKGNAFVSTVVVGGEETAENIAEYGLNDDVEFIEGK